MENIGNSEKKNTFLIREFPETYRRNMNIDETNFFLIIHELLL
jgi:hypothetical protein